MSQGDGNDRDGRGRFKAGNSGGPGRPSRKIERDYLAALSDILSIDEWKAICRAAVEKAKEGDAKARDWITRHCIGQQPPTLRELAAKEARGISSEDEITSENESEELFERIHRRNLEHFE